MIMPSMVRTVRILLRLSAFSAIRRVMKIDMKSSVRYRLLLLHD
jgi:hypothetical protein